MRLVALSLALALAGCSQDAAEPALGDDGTPTAPAAEDLTSTEPATDQVIDQSGTPMEQRVATIGVLNKRNNETRELEMLSGTSEQVGNVIVRLEACERTAAWEMPQETGAFVQVEVQERGADDFIPIFSGWLFKNSPSLNVVEHPIYDIWVKDCAMSFPGE
ncbi:MAG: DUF2155 domain-containing protein [Erythrobacter sp.]